MAKKVYATVKGITYTPVEYIESSGTQYIDTEIFGVETTKLVVEYQFLEKNDGTVQFGADLAQNDSRFRFEAGTSYFRIMGGASTDYSTVVSDLNKHTFTLDNYNKTRSIDSTSSSITYTENKTYCGITFFAWNKAGLYTNLHSARFYSAQIYESNVLKHDLIPVVDSNNIPCIYDKKTGIAYANNGTGTLTAGSPTGSSTIPTASRRIKKIFVGVNNVARLVTRAYVGVSNVARCFWNKRFNVTITKKNNASLSVARYDLTSANTPSYAIFAGGTTYQRSSASSGKHKNTVDAFNSSLTRSSPADGLRTAKYWLGGATVGNYAVFAGGSTYSAFQKQVDAYDDNLTRYTPSDLATARFSIASATVGNYALFAGGSASGGNTKAVEAYDTSLIRSTASDLSEAKNYNRGFNGATINNYAVFAGSTNTSKVEVYNSSLVKQTNAADITIAGPSYTVATTKYLFAKSHFNNICDVYSPSLVKYTTLIGVPPIKYMARAGTNDVAIFGGGSNQNDSGDITDLVSAIDNNLLVTQPTKLSSARGNLAGASIGNYILFGGGGYGNNVTTNTVDVYEIT